MGETSLQKCMVKESCSLRGSQEAVQAEPGGRSRGLDLLPELYPHHLLPPTRSQLQGPPSRPSAISFGDHRWIYSPLISHSLVAWAPSPFSKSLIPQLLAFYWNPAVGGKRLDRPRNWKPAAAPCCPVHPGWSGHGSVFWKKKNINAVSSSVLSPGLVTNFYFWFLCWLMSLHLDWITIAKNTSLHFFVYYNVFSSY